MLARFDASIGIVQSPCPDGSGGTSMLRYAQRATLFCALILTACVTQTPPPPPVAGQDPSITSVQSVETLLNELPQSEPAPPPPAARSGEDEAIVVTGSRI